MSARSIASNPPPHFGDSAEMRQEIMDVVDGEGRFDDAASSWSRESREYGRKSKEYKDSQTSKWRGSIASDTVSKGPFRSQDQISNTSLGLPDTAIHREMDVERWLLDISHEMAVYAPVLAGQRINTLDVLCELTEKDIAEFIEPEIPFAGHRVLFRRHLNALREDLGYDRGYSTPTASTVSSSQRGYTPIAGIRAMSSGGRGDKALFSPSASGSRGSSFRFGSGGGTKDSLRGSPKSPKGRNCVVS
mmetsp:Transcript_12954/g.30160  ORF Transcript_12954/g.30160 Transcript_12954/m.30160 type:complete len:247 (-) Transcript_12954:270-1010(-)